MTRTVRALAEGYVAPTSWAFALGRWIRLRLRGVLRSGGVVAQVRARHTVRGLMTRERELRGGRTKQVTEPYESTRDVEGVVAFGGKSLRIRVQGVALDVETQTMGGGETGASGAGRTEVPWTDVRRVELLDPWPTMRIELFRGNDTHDLLLTSDVSLDDASRFEAVAEGFARLFHGLDPVRAGLGWALVQDATFERAASLPSTESAEGGPFRVAASVLEEVLAEWVASPVEIETLAHVLRRRIDERTTVADAVVVTTDRVYVRDLLTKTVGSLARDSFARSEPFGDDGVVLCFGRATRVVVATSSTIAHEIFAARV